MDSNRGGAVLNIPGEVTTDESLSTTSRPHPNNIGTITTPLLINNTSKIVTIKSGITKIPSTELSQIPGHYTQVPENILNSKSVILPLMKVAKPHGFRLVAQLPRTTFEKSGLSIPDIPPLPGLDLRTTLMTTISNFATAPSNSKIILLDLTNAFAHIHYPASNVFTYTTDRILFRLDQPVQGLSIAGTLAPAVINNFFKRIIRKCRRHLKKEKRNAFLHGSAYSDNCLVVTDEPELAFSYFKKILGKLLNTEQSTIIREKTVRTLGLRWKIKDNVLIVRRPQREKSNERRNFYNFLLGRKPMITVRCDEQPTIFVDGVSDEKYLSTSAAGLYQKETLLFGIVEQRLGIDQLISESKAILLGNELRSATSKDIPIFTDSEINLSILNNPNPRNTLEARITNKIRNVVFTPSKFNLADQLTRDDQLIDIYSRKRPRKAHHSKYDELTPHTIDDTEVKKKKPGVDLIRNFEFPRLDIGDSPGIDPPGPLVGI